MPDRVLLSAFDAKRADHDCIALRLALANAEVRSSEQQTAFLSTMRDQHDGAHAVSEAYLDILDQVLGARGLAEAEGSKQHYKKTHTEQLVALAVSGAHIAQMQDVIGPRVSRWLGEGGDRKDPFRKYSEDPFDRYSEGQSSDESSGGGSPRSPTRAVSPVYSRQ